MAFPECIDLTRIRSRLGRLSAALVVIAYLSCSNCAYSQAEREQRAIEQLRANAEEIYKVVAPSVVKVIQADLQGKALSTGTGFMLEGGRIVTNYHVVKEGKTTIQVGALRIGAVLEKFDPAADLYIRA